MVKNLHCDFYIDVLPFPLISLPPSNCCRSQGSRSRSAPLPQRNEPCWPRPHLLGPPAQRPCCTDGCRAWSSCRRRTRWQRQDHDGLSGRYNGPFPPPSPAASSTCRGHERWLYVPSTNGLQVYHKLALFC